MARDLPLTRRHAVLERMIYYEHGGYSRSTRGIHYFVNVESLVVCCDNAMACQGGVELEREKPH